MSTVAWQSPSAPATSTAYEAKTHFSQLLERAANGETIVITKHGHPVARLAPLDDDDRTSRARAAFDRMRARRARLIAEGRTVTRDEIAEWIAEGHRERDDRIAKDAGL